MKKLILISIFVFNLILLGCSNEEIYQEEESPSLIEENYTESKKIVLYICGEVNNPGIYELLEGSRIYNLIDAAGGVTDEADVYSINFASELHDGQMVIVYAKVKESVDTDLSLSAGSKINLNFATKDQLMTLPGIGESKAESIIAYRDEIGWFSSADQIMNIPGIKAKMFEKISDLIEV